MPARADGLPSLPPVPASPAAEPAAEFSATPQAPSWSPVRVALPLFAAVWACFAALAKATARPDADIAALGDLLAVGAAIVALVLVTLSVAHTQVSGLWPRPSVVGIVALGTVQGLAAAAIGSGPADLWAVGAWVLVLIGVAVPLAWVAGQFQCGVRRQRVERQASLLASWVERARHHAHETVGSMHRHDVRSMLFALDGVARTVADPRLPEDQRVPSTEMLSDCVARLSMLMDVRAEEIQPFEVDALARGVAHAERKADRAVRAELPAGLRAVGRAADVAAVLRTVIAVVDRHSTTGVQLRGEVTDGVIVIRIEPGGDEPQPLLSQSWEHIWADSFKATSRTDEDKVDLYVAARLLAEQGADLWATAGRARFAVRLPAADSSHKEEA